MIPDTASEVIEFFYRDHNYSELQAAIVCLADAGHIQGTARPSWFSTLRNAPLAGITINQWAPGSDWPIIAFLSTVLSQKNNQADPEGWIDSFGAMPEPQRRSIWLAYWHAGPETCAVAITRNREQGRRAEARWLERLASLRPVPFIEMPLQGPGNLDIWWHCFFASGDAKFLDRLIASLGKVAEPQGSPGHALGLAVIWSLTSLARKHETVADHLRGTLELVTDEGMIMLLQGCLNGDAGA